MVKHQITAQMFDSNLRARKATVALFALIAIVLTIQLRARKR